MSIQNTISSWEDLLETARKNTSARRVKRPGQSPSTAPLPTGLDKLSPNTEPPVLLYRDTNSWCPFCERVWFALEEKEIPFATEFIDLSNKPQWYVDLVPTTLVPGAKIEGKLVYESKNILLALEERFSTPPLLPEDPQENAIASWHLFIRLLAEVGKRGRWGPLWGLRGGGKGERFGIFTFLNKDESLFPQKCKKQLIARGLLMQENSEFRSKTAFISGY